MLPPCAVFLFLSLFLFVAVPCSRNTRTGSTVLRDRLLEVKGFAVLPLPYWEIQQQRDAGVKARLHWLEKLLRQAAATAPRSKAGAPSRVNLASYRKGK